MNHLIPYIFILVLSLSGLALAVYIFKKKRRKEQMVCPMGSDCDAVIHSQYAKFLGIPVETLGVLYYAIVFVTYLAFLTTSAYSNTLIATGALVISSFAFLFSVYLIFIQGFVLRQWCTWCLTSAAFCAGIFLAAASSAVIPDIGFIREIQSFLIPLNAVAIAIGLGTATVIEVFFIKFLKDSRLSNTEAGVIHTLSEIIWITLAVTLISQIAIFFGSGSPSMISSIKNVVIFIIIINGAFLHPLLTPKLMRVSSGEKHEHTEGELHSLRKTTFTLTALSVASWYFLVLLSSSLRDSTLGIIQLVAIYALMFLIVLVVNGLFDLIFSRNSNRP